MKSITPFSNGVEAHSREYELKDGWFGITVQRRIGKNRPVVVKLVQTYCDPQLTGRTIDMVSFLFSASGEISARRKRLSIPTNLPSVLADKVSLDAETECHVVHSLRELLLEHKGDFLREILASEMSNPFFYDARRRLSDAAEGLRVPVHVAPDNRLLLPRSPDPRPLIAPRFRFNFQRMLI